MRIRGNKNFLRMLGLLLVLLFTVNGSVYAYQPKTQEHKLKFTDSAQRKINLIQSLVTKGGILVSDGKYVIVSESPVITKLDVDTISKVKESISMYNDGISLGLFEIDNDNYIISSKNYQNEDFQTENKTSTIDNSRIPLKTAIISFDNTLKTNGDTMARVWYINWDSYGTLGDVETGFYFATKVRTGGDWDYKLVFGPTTLYQVEINGNYEYMTGADIGNAHYGYVGRKAFSAELLRTAAGAYQICSNTYRIGWYNSYFDDPNDQYWINRGISYSEGHGF